jgi:hypothetical protein
MEELHMITITYTTLGFCLTNKETNTRVSTYYDTMHDVVVAYEELTGESAFGEMEDDLE